MTEPTIIATTADAPMANPPSKLSIRDALTEAVSAVAKVADTLKGNDRLTAARAVAFATVLREAVDDSQEIADVIKSVRDYHERGWTDLRVVQSKDGRAVVTGSPPEPPSAEANG